jgi:hypothetical protein
MIPNSLKVLKCGVFFSKSIECDAIPLTCKVMMCA